MNFDPLDADLQLLGDLPRGYALPDKLGDFELTLDERLDWRTRQLGSTVGQAVQALFNLAFRVALGTSND